MSIELWFEYTLTRLLSPSPTRLLMMQCLLVLTLFSTLLAWVAVRRTPFEHNNNKYSWFFFLLIMQIFTPCLGQIILLLILPFLKNYQKKIHPVDIAAFQNPIYVRTNPIQTLSYSEGWATVRLKVTQFSDPERKQALISLNRGSKKNINHLYHQLVSDDMEELRICAFSLLESQQNHLHDKINELLKIYQKTVLLKTKTFYAKQLAFLYWELIYLNLGEHDFRKIMLDKSKYYAEIALENSQHDPFLFVLLSRIHAENNRVEAENEALLCAQKYQAPTSKIFPYLAEKNYHQHNYTHVQHYLSADKSFKSILKLRNIINFWCKNDIVPK